MTKWEIDLLLKDPTISYWLKDALVSAFKRDIVDAINDAHILLEALADDLSNRDFDRNAINNSDAHILLEESMGGC